MRFRALFACILYGIVAGSPTPLRQRDAHGDSYEYGVNHPAGRSRVHVRTGNNRNGNHYNPGNDLHREENIPDKSYRNPHTGNFPYQPHNNGHHPNYESYQGQGRGHFPVYMEGSYPRKYVHAQQASNPYPSYDRSGYDKYPEGHVISQENLETDPFYGKTFDEYPSPVGHSHYSNPHVQQIVDDSSPNYEPGKLEQVSVNGIPSSDPSLVIIPSSEVVPDVSQNPIVQQTSDDFPINFEPNDYKQPVVSQLPLITYPLPAPSKDEQIHIDQKFLDFPTKIDVPTEEVGQIVVEEPIDSKSLYNTVPENIPTIIPIHSEPPLVQQEFIEASPPKPLPISAIKYDDDIVSQEVLDSKPPSILPLIESGTADVDRSPIVQTVVDPHPSQAVYDSSIEPNFSDSYDQSPKQFFPDQTTFLFVPEGEPYTKFSHSTDIVHPVPPHTQEHLHIEAPHTKNPPLSYSVKLPPHPQEPLHVDIPYTKNPPLSHSVKLPPPVQEPLHVDIPYTKNPPLSHSIKLPPHPQEPLHVDIPHTKKPPLSHSVKLPPPVQEPLHVDIPYTKNPPISHSIKLPPHPQEPLHVDIPHTKNHPVSYFVRHPPPIQEPLHVYIPYTKNPPRSHSIKHPPHPQEPFYVDTPHTKNPPVSYFVKHQPPVQEPLHGDIPYTRNPPLSHSIKLPPHPQEPLHVDIPHTKSPPLSHSVKLPPPVQEPLHVDIPHTKNPPLSHSIKLPPHPQEPLHVDIPHTKNPPLSHSVKLPPPVQEPLHVDIPYTNNAPLSHSIKLPPHPQELLQEDIPHTKNPPLSHSVKLPPPVQEPLQVDIPYTNNAPLSHSIKLPPHPQELLHEDIPHTKNPPLSHSVKLPPPVQEPLHAGIPFTNNAPLSHSIKLPPHPQEPLHVEIPHTKNPPLSHSIKLPPHTQEPLQVDIPHTKNSPLSHSIKLPPNSQEYLIDDALPPISHSVKSPSTSIKTGYPHVKVPPVGSHSSGFYPVGAQIPHISNSVKHPSISASPHSSSLQDDSHSKYPLQSEDLSAKYPPVSHGVELSDFDSSDAPNPHIFPEHPNSEPGKSPFEKYAPVSHSIRLPIPPATPKILSLEDQADKGEKIDKLLKKYPRVSHAVRLPILEPVPKVTTSVPNLFAAVPLTPVLTDSEALSSGSPIAEAQLSGAFSSSSDSLPRSESHSPVSHSVRLSIPKLRTSNRRYASPKEAGNDVSGVGSLEDFPAFPVKSALTQEDPVADHVANLPRPQGYRTSAGYGDSNHEPEEESPDSPSISEAKLEVEKLNREIGVSFGSRISPYSRF